MSPAWMFWSQFFLVLTAILLGIRRGGVALGLIGGLGVAVLTFGFRMAPSEPPIAVMLIILAVVTASATLQVAGGLDYLVQITERVLRAHPKQVTFLAPLSTFLLTVCVGTGHAVYALLPVIADVALKTRNRPERPMAISSVASQMGITASPVADRNRSATASKCRSSPGAGFKRGRGPPSVRPAVHWRNGAHLRRPRAHDRSTRPPHLISATASRNRGWSALPRPSKTTISVVTISTPFRSIRASAAALLSGRREPIASATT